MADALFDTTVFIDYSRGDKGADGLILRLRRGELRASYSPLTVFELWIGRMEEEEEMTHRAILARMEQAPLEALAAEQAALWLRQTPGGSEALFRDALIAATAAERGEPIYTRNVRDFKRFYANVQSY